MHVIVPCWLLFQAFHCSLVPVVGPDWCKSCWGFRGKVCGSVCHSAGGTKHYLGPLESSWRPKPLTGKKNKNKLKLLVFMILVTHVVDE